jgi:hypothetical protein
MWAVGPVTLLLVALVGGVAGLSPLASAIRARDGIQAPSPFFPEPDPNAERGIRALRAAFDARASMPRDLPPDAPLPEAWLALLAEPGAEEPAQTWVSLYVPSRQAKVRGPWISDLSGGLGAAAARIWATMPAEARTPERLTAARWKWDRLDGAPRRVDRQGGPGGVAIDKGIDGVLLRAKDGREFRWLPSQVLEKQVARGRVFADLRQAAQGAGWSKEEASRARTFTFRARTWVEGGAGRVLPVGRGNVDVPELSATLLRERIALAAGYLSRETNDKGRITYEYQGRDEKTGSSYNLLRHAGTLYSMVQAYRLSGDPDVLAASRRAAGYLLRQTRADQNHPGEWFTVDGSRAKLGGDGLGLMALVELEKAAPGSVDREILLGLARHIERMQNPDGSFTCFYDYDGKRPSLERSVFYPGEAMLGLARLEQLTGDTHWVDVAVRGADYLVHDQWVGYGLRVMVAPDAWLLQALEELDRVRPDAERRQYAFAVARAIVGNKLMDPLLVPPDLLGADLSSIRNLPNAATAGSYGEALSAAARLEARTGGGRGPWFDAAMTNARYQIRNQFTEDNSWWLANPQRALGGFRLRADDAEIRNDYVQHNLSGLFGLLPLLDPGAPDLGLRVAGGSP